MKNRVWLLVAFSLFLTACFYRQSNISHKQARAIVLGTHSIYEEAVIAKDLESILSLYQDNAIYLPLQGEILEGKEQISKAWTSTFALPVVGFDLELISVEVDGDYIYEVGRTHSTFDMPQGPVPGEFKYLNVWRKQPEGGYKIFRAAYNQWVSSSE